MTWCCDSPSRHKWARKLKDNWQMLKGWKKGKTRNTNVGMYYGFVISILNFQDIDNKE
jgi:hypothetical protein